MAEKEPLTVQGEGAHEIFAGAPGNPAIEKMYSESATYFADIIRNLLKPQEQPYEMLDVGSFKGELLQKILQELGDEYNFHTIGIDKDEVFFDGNKVVDSKINGDISEMPIKDKSVDVAIVRYVLQWNSAERQKQILRELDRVCREFAIIQHAGADRENTEVWQERMHHMVFGGLPKVSRPEGYFSSPSEIEEWMEEAGIHFQKLQDRKIEKVSSVFAEKYKLNEEETKQAEEILGDTDSIQQTTWIIGNKI